MKIFYSKFHIPCSNSIFIIANKSESKENFRSATILFYILLKYFLRIGCIFFRIYYHIPHEDCKVSDAGLTSAAQVRSSECTVIIFAMIGKLV
jgi:hypothetical protein